VLSGVLGLCLAVAISARQNEFEARCAAVRQNTLRLHILAADDSVPAQAAKLRVKDAVVRLAGRLYGGAQDIRQAKRQAARSLPRLVLAAGHALRQQGMTLPVSAGLCRQSFAPRQYGQYTLPGGVYDAVRLTIGEGQGQNWWCCLYPQLCLSACSGYAEQEQQTLVTGGYEVRFWLADWWRRVTAPPPKEEPPVLECVQGG